MHCFGWGSPQPLPSPPPFPEGTWPSAAVPSCSCRSPGGGRGSCIIITSSYGHYALTSPLHHYLGRRTLEGRGQGIGEETEVDWEEELHEGMMIKTEKGTTRKMSAAILRNWI